MHEESAWIFLAPGPLHRTYEAAAEALADLLEPRLTRFSQLPPGLEITVYIDASREPDEYCGEVSVRCVRLFGQIGAAIAFDLEL